MKECAICGGEFEYHRRTDQTCSLECQIEYRRKLNRDKARRHYKPRAPRPPYTCIACGSVEPTQKMGPTPKFCRPCRAKQESQRAARKYVGGNRFCHKCAEPVPGAIGKPGLTVCDNCRVDPRANGYEKERRRTLRKYGITQNDFDEMLHNQDNRCLICKADDPGNKGWCIDHCHDTGLVRALLCNACNMALGQVRENPRILRSMIEYVESWERKVKI